MSTLAPTLDPSPAAVLPPALTPAPAAHPIPAPASHPIPAPALDPEREAVGRLLDEVRRPGTQPFGLYAIAGDDPNAELGRLVERTVFGDVFGESPALLEAEYRRYERSSIFFVVADHRRRVPAGVVRVIVPSPAGQKTLDDLAVHWDRPLDRLRAENPGVLTGDAIWDLATQAVMPAYRGKAKCGLVSMAMYRAVFVASALAGVDWWVAVMDDPVMRYMNLHGKGAFHRFAGVASKRYLGSPSSTPTWTDYRAWAEALRRRDRFTHDLLADRDDDPVLSVPDWDGVVELVRRCGWPDQASGASMAAASRVTTTSAASIGR